MKKLHLISLGCTKNLVDSEIMLNRLKDYEITNDVSEADLLIVNSCGFINSAKEESLQTIFNLHEARKEGSILAVAGCLTERYREALQNELKEVDIFTGVGDYDSIDELVRKRESRFSDKTFLIENQARIVSNSNYHSYIKLSEGCNQKCSFCAIPNFKGKLQSRSLRTIANEVKTMVENGFYDFSFISQDSSSYLRDFNIDEGLVKLIDEMNGCSKIKSARILYLYPTTTSDKLIDKIIDSEVFFNYFDMPIQHISDRLLKVMKRGAGKKRIIEQLTKMRKAKNSFLRTSVIVGHPTESEEDFNQLKEFLKNFDFDRVTIFAYSDEEDTSAFEMEEKIPDEIIEKRINILQKIIDEKQQKSLQKDLNKKIIVSIDGESSEGEFFIGAKKDIWALEIDGEILINENESGEELKIGSRYIAKITEVVGDKLMATLIKRL